MTVRIAALAALAALVPVAAAGAVDTLGLLPPVTPVTGPPPLRPGASAVQTTNELRIPINGHVDGRALVVVGVGPDGRPVAITATQRLQITGSGDYAFLVPAPAVSVTPGPGTQSAPGLRNTGIVWQGFADRRRTLSAVATLDPAPAAAGLPLRVRIEHPGATTLVRLTDVARRSIPVLFGRVAQAVLQPVLAKMRAGSTPTRINGGPWFLAAHGVASTQVAVAAPLHVTGTIEQNGVPRPVDVVLGAGRPLARAIRVRGTGTPRLRLRVDLLGPLAMLPTARALARARRPIPVLQRALGSIATMWAYRHFLATPDPAGDSQTVYAYRSAPPPARAAAAVPITGDHAPVIALAIALALAALAGLAALWARS